MSGLVHVYHGDGKGKTTAAMGLALRVAGSGAQVVIVQFLKGRDSGEIEMLKKIPGVTVLRGKNGTKFSVQMDETEKQAAQQAHESNLAEALKLVQTGACGLLVLDEAMGALSTGMLGDGAVRQLLRNKPPELELVFTGRNPPRFILDAADYITEMKCVRHPYEKGISARRGIEF